MLPEVNYWEPAAEASCCEEEKQEKLECALGLKRFPFKFENDGTSVAHIGNKYW